MTDHAAEASRFPMFYQEPRPIDRAKDATKRVRQIGFGFARKTNAIPLLIEELPIAAASYPIVFAAGQPPILAAVVGLETNHNLFVDEDGKWLNNGYLPAYVRRYPFILMDDTEEKQFLLCIDAASEFLNEEEGEPLFEDGQASEFLTKAMDFSAQLRQSGVETDSFVRALQQFDLLEMVNVQLPFSTGASVQLAGMLTISPQRLDALPDSALIEWRRRDWLGPIYAQLLSSYRWHSLAQLYGNRHGAEFLPPASSPQRTSASMPPPRLSKINEEPTAAGFRLVKRPARGEDF
jgi:SapC